MNVERDQRKFRLCQECGVKNEDVPVYSISLGNENQTSTIALCEQCVNDIAKKIINI